MATVKKAAAKKVATKVTKSKTLSSSKGSVTAKKVAAKVKAAPKKTATAPVKKKEVKPQEEMLLQSLRGMRDILPDEQPYWERARRILAQCSHEFGYQRIDLPTVEYAHLYLRTIGEGTDIVDKEIYLFNTRGGDKVALRPEMTAGLCRAYIEHGMGVLSKPIKLFSTGPVFRYDRPQEGRYREHWQANFDVFGEADAILDAQVVQLAYRVVHQLGLRNIEFQVNSIGTPESRKEYEKIVVRIFVSGIDKAIGRF
jgi:histidyl-tRNA synthetase